MQISQSHFHHIIGVPCSPLKKSAHLIKPSKLDGYLFGGEVPFECAPFYQRSDNSSPALKCDVNSHNKSAGTWNDTQPNCSGSFCSSEHVPEYLRMTPRKEQYNIGGNATFYCNNGYSGITAFSTCTHLNTWTPPLPVCTRISCIQENKTNQVLYMPSKNIYEYHEEVMIVCIPGMFGITTMSKCSSMNTWDPSPPQCLESYEKPYGVSYAVYSGTSAAIVGLAIIIIIPWTWWMRRKARQKEKLYEDIHVDTDQRNRNGNPDEAYAELLERSEYWNTDPYRKNIEPGSQTRQYIYPKDEQNAKILKKSRSLRMKPHDILNDKSSGSTFFSFVIFGQNFEQQEYS